MTSRRSFLATAAGGSLVPLSLVPLSLATSQERTTNSAETAEARSTGPTPGARTSYPIVLSTYSLEPFREFDWDGGVLDGLVF